MEIDIDAALVTAIVNDEYAQTSACIAQAGPFAALEQSQRRHDERLLKAADAATLACRAGCSWCCHFTIDVRAVEVVRVLDFVSQHLSAAEQDRVHAEVVANRATLQSLDDMQRMQRNIRCPFLVAGQCSIYEARPQTCRNYHATDVAGCKQSFDEPDNLDIDPEFAPFVYQSGAAHVDAFSKAMRDAGYDTGVYEFNTALAHAWEAGDTRDRVEAKQSAFATLAGEDVGFEFVDE